MSDLTAGLNPAQKKAVLKTEGPVLILAGAGSGKTTVLTHRIAYIIEQGVKPYNIMAITFTNKAAREMKERVERITPFGKDVWVSTFHSSCVRILRRDIERLGYTSQFTIYDSDDSERLIKDILKEFNISDKDFSPKMVMGKISGQKNELISAKAFDETAGEDFWLKTIGRVYTEYQKRLKQNNALDFDDLIFKTVQLFAQNPDILDKYREKFLYIMIDEYQDTNSCQYNLIRQLSSKYRNLCVVGDDDQSIYGWRGANIRNILDFEKDFKNAEVIKLEQNYRSTKVILDAANTVIKNNISRKSKELWTENEAGGLIKAIGVESDFDEAAFIAAEIEKGVKNGGEYKDFAILYRNNAMSRVIEDRFVRSSIPYRLLGGIPFYGRKEIKDVMCYLKVLYNSSDDIALKRIINVPKRGIGIATIEKVSLFAEDSGMSFFEALLNAEDIPGIKSRGKKLTDFAGVISNFREASEELKISELLEKIISETGYRDELESENTAEALNRIENINELISKAVEFENTAERADLSAFLEEVALVADIDGYSEDDDTVVLMTLHSSKGLEFPNVFIAGFEEGIFPSYRSILSDNPNAVEEERRLCYVGITRAKRQLYFTYARSRMQHGQTISNAPSRFLKEVPMDFIEKRKSADSKNEEKQATFRNKAKYNPIGNKEYFTYGKIPAPKNITLDFKEGDKVRQIKYGVGVVKNIAPAGADFEVTVEFPEAGTKKFMAMLSKNTLKKI